MSDIGYIILAFLIISPYLIYRYAKKKVNATLKQITHDKLEAVTRKGFSAVKSQTKTEIKSDPIDISNEHFWKGLDKLVAFHKEKVSKPKLHPDGVWRATPVDEMIPTYPTLRSHPEGVVLTFNDKIARGAVENYLEPLIERLRACRQITKELCELQNMPLPYEFLFKQYDRKLVVLANGSIDSGFEIWKKALSENISDEGRVLIGESIKDGEEHSSPTNLLYLDLAVNPHFMVVGKTRSGKTKSVLSLCASLAFQYPNSRFFFADGKGSPDYNAINRKVGFFKFVAKIVESVESLIQIANVIHAVWDTYKTNKRTFGLLSKEHGRDASTIADYNKIAKEIGIPEVPRTFLVIDEFAEITSEGGGSIEKAAEGKNGNIFQRIRLLASGGASYGIHLIIASQRAQRDSFPPPIRSNLTTLLAHGVKKEDEEFLGLSGLTLLKEGRFALVSAYHTQPDGSHLICRLPYFGAEAPKFIMDMPDKQDQQDFNMEIIFSISANESESESELVMSKKFKSVLRDASVEVDSVEFGDAYIGLVADLEGKTGFLFEDAGLLNANTSVERLLAVFPEDIDKKYVVASGALAAAKEQSLMDAYGKAGIILLVPGDYLATLNKYFSATTDDLNPKKFINWLNDKEVAFVKGSEEEAAKISGPEFYRTRAWRTLRYKMINKLGRRCVNCKKTSQQFPDLVFHCDHIKPRSLYPHLALTESNMQILCEDCNLGKSNKFEINHIEEEATEKAAETQEKVKTAKEVGIDPTELAKELIATGKFSVRDIASRTGISKSMIQKIKDKIKAEAV